jgi:hypothetical protein
MQAPQIDPASGNAVPPGALPKEVRDDRPIMASEGEYVIPADVVRYLGLEKIESLVNKAKEGLAEKHAQGRIGGQPLGAQAAERGNAPAPREGRPMAPPAAPMTRPPGMATGGMVSTQGPMPPQMVAYVSPSGQTTYIPFVNGQPITTIPQGYTRSTAQPAAPAQSAGGGSTGGGQPTFGKLAEAGKVVKSPDQWSVQDFISYGDTLTSPVDNIVRGVANAMVPGARWMDRLAQNNVDKQVPGMLDNMIETGMDANGQPIADADVQSLIRTRETMRDQLAQESGQPANPFERVSSFVSRLFGGGQSGSVSTQGPQDGQASSTGRSDNATLSGMLTAAPDKQQKDAGVKSGFFSGGLVSKPVSYAKGGLVTKRC